jgi:hypothetical protein
MTNSRIKAGALLLLAASATANADNDFGLGVKAGTLGIGLEATWQPLPYFDLRIGANAYDYDEDGTQAGIPYEATLALDSFYLTGSFHFPMSPMRVTLGAFSNGNELQMLNDDAADLNLGGITYPGAGIGTLTSVTSFASTSPYLGIGFDFSLGGKVGMNLDLGVLWQGDPEVTLEADGLLAQDPLFQASLEAERLELEDELSDFKAWPAVSLGFFYRF